MEPNKKLSIFTLGMFCLALLSCNSSIDRNDAEKIINETYFLPKPLTRYLISSKVDLETSNWQTLFKGEAILHDNGFRNNIITNQYRAKGLYSWPHTVVNFTITEKTTPFVKQTIDFTNYQKHEINVGTIHFDNIATFRAINESEYEIEFYLNGELNEIGLLMQDKICMSPSYIVIHPNDEILDYGSKLSVPEGKLGPFKQRILKYDNGWQITSEDIEKLNRVISLKKRTVNGR